MNISLLQVHCQGVWCVVCGVWGVVCGVWCVVCGVWGVGCGLWGLVFLGYNLVQDDQKHTTQSRPLYVLIVDVTVYSHSGYPTRGCFARGVGCMVWGVGFGVSYLHCREQQGSRQLREAHATRMIQLG